MEKRKHWFYYLPSSPVSTYAAERQIILREAIERMKLSLQRLENEFENGESLLTDDARKEWSIEEITEAKQEYIKNL